MLTRLSNHVWPHCSQALQTHVFILVWSWDHFSPWSRASQHGHKYRTIGTLWMFLLKLWFAVKTGGVVMQNHAGPEQCSEWLPMMLTWSATGTRLRCFHVVYPHVSMQVLKLKVEETSSYLPFHTVGCREVASSQAFTWKEDPSDSEDP